MNTHNKEDSAEDVTNASSTPKANKEEGERKEDVTDASSTPKENKEEGERKEHEDSTTEPKIPKIEEKKGDECCICLEELPKLASDFSRFTCCGNGVHIHCSEDLVSTSLGKHCPLCRALTPTSERESVKYLLPWVKKKKAWSQVMMGKMYENGSGVKQSFAKAKKLYELAAQQRSVDALVNLAWMYENGLGVEQSYERAKEYYEQATQLGDAGAYFNLGCMYEKVQSFTKARVAYEFGVQHHNASCMLNLGMLYVSGREGVAKDMVKARELWTEAADFGEKTAIRNLKKMDRDERRMAALDPTAVVCSFCGLPETETRNFSKTKCPCKSTWYCNRACQKKHWKEHRTECKRLIVELKREKKGI